MRPTAVTTTAADVVAAVNGQRLAEWAAADDSPVADHARLTCATIGRQVGTDVQEITTWLRTRGHTVTADADQAPRQRHDVRVGVASFEHADAVAHALAERGFERWDDWTGAAARSFRRHADQITVARTAEHSVVLRLVWGRPPDGGRVRRLLRALFRPTPGDWSMVSLPAWSWPAYSLLRPVRLVLERSGRRDPHAAGLGPFLSTPRSLIEPLVELAELAADDVLLDVGCGDGRLAIGAAQAIGCRAIGAEHDDDLARRARRAVADAGLEDLVTIHHGDARLVDLSEVTVVFMFLPMDVVAEIVASTLDRLPIGARLVVHEQTALPSATTPRPDSSHAVIADDAVTVAHLWTRR